MDRKIEVPWVQVDIVALRSWDALEHWAEVRWQLGCHLRDCEEVGHRLAPKTISLKPSSLREL